MSQLLYAKLTISVPDIKPRVRIVRSSGFETENTSTHNFSVVKTAPQRKDSDFIFAELIEQNDRLQC